MRNQTCGNFVEKMDCNAAFGQTGDLTGTYWIAVEGHQMKQSDLFEAVLPIKALLPGNSNKTLASTSKRSARSELKTFSCFEKMKSDEVFGCDLQSTV
ncbi:MAG: hypothetical protein H7834_16265 [Magnetococcus sp. YQC-9]